MGNAGGQPRPLVLVAAPWGGVLHYAANVRTGFTAEDRRRLPIKRLDDEEAELATPTLF